MAIQYWFCRNLCEHRFPHHLGNCYIGIGGESSACIGPFHHFGFAEHHRRYNRHLPDRQYGCDFIGRNLVPQPSDVGSRYHLYGNNWRWRRGSFGHLELGCFGIQHGLCDWRINSAFDRNLYLDRNVVGPRGTATIGCGRFFHQPRGPWIGYRKHRNDHGLLAIHPDRRNRLFVAVGFGYRHKCSFRSHLRFDDRS